jgi:hypothetical protein
MAGKVFVIDGILRKSITRIFNLLPILSGHVQYVDLSS